MLKFSKKPTMLAAGCSFTDPAFSSLFHPDWDFSYDKWPDHVAQHLKVKHENIVINKEIMSMEITVIDPNQKTNNLNIIITHNCDDLCLSKS